MNYSSYPCSVCGLCCMHISEVAELKEYDLGNGVCKYYSLKNRECTIYEHRPAICRVDEMYEKVYKNFYSKAEFYSLNAEVCNSLQEKYGIDKSFRIKIKGE